jgi:ribose/xylose/arabinose/galactoside ABC-type transport system permease subunit
VARRAAFALPAGSLDDRSMETTTEIDEAERASLRVTAQQHVVRYLRTGGLVLALVGIGAYFTASSPYFLTKDNLYNILLQSSNIAIVAAGLTVVLIAAEIDLSIGSVEALSGAVAAVVIIRYGAPVGVGIAAALGCSVLAGLISGLFTWKLKVVSFISTLAMLGIAQGVAFLLTNGQAVAGFPDSYKKIGTAEIHGFPGAVVIAIAVFVGLHLMLNRTRLGAHIFAVGGNAESASLAGIRPGRIKLATLMISGLCAGIGGLIVSARLDAGNGLFGANDLLAAVAAVVIGGASLFGGVGSVIGTAVGVLIITTINNGMVLLNVPDFWQQIVVGCIILAAMVLDQLTKAAGLPGA